MQKSIFVRGDFDAYRITDEELKEHSIFAKTEDGCEYNLQNPTENFYYTLKKNLEKSLTWSGHKLQDRTSRNGLKISIENKKGSVRRGVDKDGHQWATKMHFDYGYIRGSEGTDGRSPCRPWACSPVRRPAEGPAGGSPPSRRWASADRTPPASRAVSPECAPSIPLSLYSSCSPIIPRRRAPLSRT